MGSRKALAWIGIAGAVGVLALAWWWSSGDGGRRGPAHGEPLAEAGAPRADPPSSPAVAAGGSEGRTQAAPAPVPEASPARASEPDAAAVVSVRFVDAAGAPVAGVVLVAPRSGGEARSDGAGNARIELGARVLGTAVDLVASCAGYARDRRRATVPENGRLLLGDWVLVPGGEVQGRVVGPDGVGLPGIGVGCLVPELEREAEWFRARRGALETLARPGAVTETDAAGDFRLEGVPAGSVRLVAVAGDRPAARSQPVEVPAGGLAHGVEIRMESIDGGTAIAGLVLDPAGEPLTRRVRVRVEGGGSSMEVLSAVDGTFRVRVAHKRACTVTVLDPELRYREAVARDVQPGTTNLVLQLVEASGITLAARDERGGPLERFGVEVLPADGEVALAAYPEEARANGELVFSAPAQPFRVVVRANGRLPARLGPFAADPPPAELTCVLEPAGGIAGIVTAGGLPVAGAGLRLYAAAERDDRYNGFPVRVRTVPVNETASDVDGRFALSVEVPGTYYVRAEADGHAPAEVGPLALAPDRHEEAHVELGAGGALAVRVRSAAGASVVGRLVAISRGDGFARTARTDEVGAVAFTALVPGPWQVELAEEEIDPRFGATRFGTQPAREIPANCRVVEGETTLVDLWLEAPSTRCVLSGRLVLDGAPASTWAAGFEREAGALEPFQEPGTFRIGSDEPGPQRLMLRADTQDPAEMLVLVDVVELVEGERHWSLDLATGALEGALAGGDGEGSAGPGVFYRWTRGSLEAYAPVVPGPDGRFRCARVPSGAGELVRVDPERKLWDQVPTVLRRVDVRAGRTTLVE